MTANVTLVGNATRDVELRFTPNGTPAATFGIAVNRRWKNQQGDWEENVSFFNVTCWRDLANNVAETVAKGTRVIVSGRLEQRSWENQAGEKRSVVEVVADEVGPSLRWATAEVQRNERSQTTAGASGGGEQRAYDPSEEPFLSDPFLIWEQT